ncbi:DUF4293 domain-containing protein [Flavobacteriaceae bacterium]|nr:DUF4293 domain-containing protein [Flavobacteriaceae bacterium]
MIQRVQTIYMIAIIGALLILFFSSPEVKDEDYTYILDIVNYFNLMISILMAINLFLFKKRNFQIKINLFIIALLVIEIVFWGIIISRLENTNPSVFVLLLLPLCILLLIITNKNIRKDEDLVRSVDRLR